ncbi:hypothetical protein [Carboxylicivirga marina]|uniref:Uncharacterized protein n=1 Tax=Carboxylicivirga marina TaxID=2800988 RepID=A0ABS1HKQ0_9BACT|nr:hypothetical protein [Carboxylicivirga marina]MBK3518252.1 hypothetical protein [Carboxylicivirga marina]
MFGLETISHWHFIKALALCLIGYYVIVILYLKLRHIQTTDKMSFEQQATSLTNKEPVHKVRASDYPSEEINLSEQDTEGLRACMDEEPDYSGYALEHMTNKKLPNKEAFLNSIEYEIQQTKSNT